MFADGFDPASVGLGGLVAQADGDDGTSPMLGGLNEVGQVSLYE